MTMRVPSLFLLSSFAASVGGCFVVEDGPLASLRVETDGGVDGGMNTVPVAETCGGVGAFVITTSQELSVDTTSATNNLGGTCGTQAPGNDAYLRLDVASGEFWHFHLQARTPGRDPFIYVFPVSGQTCNTMANCEMVRNRCRGTIDQEHFGVRFPGAGTWYVGVDDTVAGGGVYTLSAFRPVLNNGTLEHGEGCDDGNTTLGDGCDSKGRIELSGALAQAREPNDDPFWANYLIVTRGAAGMGVGGNTLGQCDGEYFTFHLDGSENVTIQFLDASTGVSCVDTIDYDAVLLDASGVPATNGSVALINNCRQIKPPSPLPAGDYTLAINGAPDDTTVRNFRFNVRIEAAP